MSSTLRLDGRCALVTGASKNLGRRIALTLAEAGARVVINTRQDVEGANAVADEIRDRGGDAMVVIADVGDSEAVDRMAASIEDRFGHVGILVNNAVLRPRYPFATVELKNWKRVLQANLLGAIFCARRFLPGMIDAGGGSIVNMAGINVYDPMSERAHTITSKAALIGLTRGLAKEMGPKGIRVNIIVPGIFDTPRSKEDYPMWPLPPEVAREMVPLGRFGQPEEIARLCLFLASDAASYVTGQAIHCNGGRVMV